MELYPITTKIRAYWETISTSYWFIPACLMAVSVVLCSLCLALVQRASIPGWLLAFFPVVTQSGAQQLLSTLATSIITATSIAFSMTLVALVMASSQFGPRLLRTFMLDKGTQVVLGVLVSTFLYCLISLHHLSSITQNEDALSIISASSAILTILDVVCIIYFIHHLANFIQADEIIYRCFSDFLGDIDSLLPRPEDQPDERPLAEELTVRTSFSITLFSECNNYVQTINYRELINRNPDIIAGLEVFVRSGDYVAVGDPVITFYGRGEISKEMVNKYRKYLVFGRQRTPVQDPEFAVSQLVEIALRALSPGINDPYTAITCLDRLTSACVIMHDREFPANCVVNTSTNIWLLRRTFALASVINTAFDQIRQAGESHMAINLHLMHCYKTLKNHLDTKYHPLLKSHAKATMYLASKQTFSDKEQDELDQANKRFLQTA
ncbi:DUF2254 domain-containing protein [Teredinibacter turnerae]|uniref:DUF2254 domain-containing protein n=1 Tax=Teredinibacter turnerae TaxID=2426 RepID=UPI00036F6424|nr:DUF2254 domain-containing protein [Teredinibacter turnerae]